MTLAAVIPRVVLAGAGTRGPFNFSRDAVNIPLRQLSHLRVERQASDGGRTLLVSGTHYDVTSTLSGGWFVNVSVTLRGDQPVLASTERIIMRRITPRNQATSFVAGGDFPSAASELAHDLAFACAQDLAAIDEEQVIWIFGSGAPALSLGVPGQMYVNTVNGDIWGPKQDTWPASASANFNGAASSGYLLKANNLSEIASPATALSNLNGQPFDLTLVAMAGANFSATNAFLYATGVDAVATTNAAGMRTQLQLNAANASAINGKALLVHGGAFSSGTITVQSGGSPSGGADGDIVLIY